MMKCQFSLFAALLLFASANCSTIDNGIHDDVQPKDLTRGRLTNFTFSGDILTICCDEDVSMAASYQLDYNSGPDSSTQKNKEGVGSSNDDSCADFDFSDDDDGYGALLENMHEYDFYAYTVNETEGFTATARLTIPEASLEVTTVYVDGEYALYRASGTFDSCLDDSLDDVCYSITLDTFTTAEKCDNVENEASDSGETVTVCQPVTQPTEPEGEVAEGSDSIVYLQYDGRSSNAQAELGVTNVEGSAAIEVVTLDADGTAVDAFGCTMADEGDGASCQLSSFNSSTGDLTYLIVNVNETNTAIASNVSSIQDINLQWYYSDPLFEFGFFDFDDEGLYFAELLDTDGNSAGSTTIDCSDVDTGVCFGFLATEDDQDEYLLRMSLADASDGQYIQAPVSTNDVFPTSATD